jgi:hypothetical protein
MPGPFPRPPGIIDFILDFTLFTAVEAVSLSAAYANPTVPSNKPPNNAPVTTLFTHGLLFIYPILSFHKFLFAWYGYSLNSKYEESMNRK